jgi:WD40 repeat protein
MIKTGPDAGQGVGGICDVHLPGHEYAVRKVQWSPHRPDVLASASYDMTCRVYVLHNFIILVLSESFFSTQMDYKSSRGPTTSTSHTRSAYGVCCGLRLVFV